MVEQAKTEKVRDLSEAKRDGWENTITALGTSRDKRSGARIKVPRQTIAREHFEDLYTADDMAATLVELPAKEMIREWIRLQISEAAKDERGAVVADPMKASTLVMSKLDELGAKTALYEAEVWARVFGGALIFLGVDDGAEDLAEPLNLDAVRSFNFLQVFDRFEVVRIQYDDDRASATFGQPITYTLQPLSNSGVGAVAQDTIHASRFIRIDGVLTSKRRKSNNSGWNDSVYIRLEEVLSEFGSAWGSTSHLIQDFSQAVIKMRGLAEAIASDDDDLVLARVQAMDMCRSVARAIPLDAEDEDFVRVATPVSGLPELLDRFAIRLASAARMPVTLLMGMSPGGLNATGESDVQFFYDQIKASQEAKLRKPINRLIELTFAASDGPTEPASWSFEFNPLWQASDKEKSEIRKSQADTDAIYIDRGVLSESEVADSRFGGDSYSTETVLDKDMREGDEPDLDAILEAAKAPNNAPAPNNTPADATTGSEGEQTVDPKEALNGAQVTAMVAVVQSVAEGSLSKATAFQILEAAFPISVERITAMLDGVEEVKPAAELPKKPAEG